MPSPFSDPRLTPKRVLFFSFFHVVGRHKKTPEALSSEVFCVAQIGLEPMTLRV